LAPGCGRVGAGYRSHWAIHAGCFCGERDNRAATGGRAIDESRGSVGASDGPIDAPGAVQGTSQTILADEANAPFAFTANGVVIIVQVQGPIPTVSEWGLFVLALLLLIAGTVIFHRRRSTLALIAYIVVGAALLIAATPRVGFGQTERSNDRSAPGHSTSHARTRCMRPPLNCQLPDQMGHGSDGVLAATSDLNPSAGFRVGENFLPAETGAIAEVCWFGIYIDFSAGAVDCAPGTGDDFTITYYRDNDRIPGGMLASFSQSGGDLLTFDKAPTGNLVGGAQEFQFAAQHPALPLVAGECGWIEIVNNTVGSCFWLWETAPPGDVRAAQDAGGGYAPTDYDLALCLDIETATDGCATSDIDDDGVPDCLDNCPGPPPGDPVSSDGCPLAGACCLGSFFCVDGLTLDDCNLNGGEYLGDETACGPGKLCKGFEDCSEPNQEPHCEGCECGPCGGEDKSLSDPVYLFNGEFHHEQTDLRILGQGFDFAWQRKYRSQTGPNTAQGNGWDFSQKRSLQPCGPDLMFRDGTGRSDRFRLQPDGTWTRREYFRVIEQQLDGSYKMTHADRTISTFAALDGSAAEGKITSIVDRNGNTMTFDYDVAGRLITIHDTLDTPAHNRDITVTYGANGFIESVTDFIGRTWTYAYYDGVEPGGNFGDLKSVTTPPVVGTPNGNDFPSGKTTVYTYSAGFADPRLNSNLLTITDPKGQTYLVNEYAATLSPTDLEFDRVMAQTYGEGDGNDRYDFVYEDGLDPNDPANNGATQKAIVNNRAGDVKELFYDPFNRMVIRREYSGRAPDPASPTELDLCINLPVNPLRPADPAFFETRYEWNFDSQPVRTTLPNGNVEARVYDTCNPSARSRGNLLIRKRLPGPLGGDQAQIVEIFEYDTDLGGCCGTNFVTREVDGRGHETLHDYDASGNRIQTQHRIPSIIENWEYNAFGQRTKHILPDNGSGSRREDVYIYYMETDGFQNGYLKQEKVDAANLALTTTREYDPVGNVVRAIDARGHNTLYTVNALDQVVRETSREVTDGGGIRYQKDTYYDANNNVVRVDVQNVDDEDVVQPNSHFTTVYEYEILNKFIRTCQESGNYTGAVPGSPNLPTCAGLPESEFVTTEYEYDANRNRTLVRYGEAVEGRQPNNVARTIYDERDMVFQVIRGQGDPEQSTTQYDYDLNGNLKFTREGIESSPRVSENLYDGYNRLKSTIDAMGNVSERHYDANGNIGGDQSPGVPNPFGIRISGEVPDIVGSAGNVRLSEATYTYDAMDRRTRTDVAFFDTQTQAPIGDGQSTTITAYSANSQVVLVTDDNGHLSAAAYDTANRVLTVTDAKGNSVTNTYDANSNVISVTELEKSDLLSPDETFVATFAYDNLDRLIQTTDNIGNAIASAYDSRGNRTHTVDALNHEIRSEYDGLNRVTATTRDLDGDGADGDDTDIVTTQTWDDTSRLTSQGDDNGNATTYVYDALNRTTATQYADGTIHTTAFDVHDNAITMTDANGSVVTTAYDLLNRQTGKTIVPGPGVADQANGGTTAETFQYDGLSRLIRAEDNDSLVSRQYDSLSNTVREVQNQVPPFGAADDRVVLSTYDGIGNKLTCTYPGGRVINTTFDELDRKKTITDTTGAPQMIAAYDYIGPGRVERRDYGNGTRTTYQYDGIANPPNDFGVRRIVGMTHTKIAAGEILDDRTFTWDKMYNKTRRKDVRAGGPQLTHDYSYDDIYRLVQTNVADGGGMTIRDTNYALDGVGNREEVTGEDCPGGYSMYATSPEPADRQLNQYSRTPFDGRQYDKNGNLVAVDACTQCQRYGDLVPPGPPAGNCVVDLDDILCVLDDFGGLCEGVDGIADIAPCGGNAVIDLDDILAVLDAFGGNYACPHPCPAESVGCAPGSATVRYDYRNQMVEYNDLFGGQRHTYAYDALGRRIAKIVNADGVASRGLQPARTPVSPGDNQQSTFGNSPPPLPRGGKGGAIGFGVSEFQRLGVSEETRFLLDGWREIEEQDAAGATLATYVYGLYIDEVLTMRRLFPSPSKGEGQGGPPSVPSLPPAQAGVPSDYFYHTDDLYNVMAVTDSGGNVAERYEYQDYGQPADPLTANPIADPQSVIGNPYRFTGRRYDPETGWYYYRTRYVDPASGRFTTRDTLGLWRDSLGNGYVYAGTRPTVELDPAGMQPVEDALEWLTKAWKKAEELADIAAEHIVGAPSLPQVKPLPSECKRHVRKLRVARPAAGFHTKGGKQLPPGSLPEPRSFAEDVAKEGCPKWCALYTRFCGENSLCVSMGFKLVDYGHEILPPRELEGVEKIPAYVEYFDIPESAYWTVHTFFIVCKCRCAFCADPGPPSEVPDAPDW